MIEAAAGDIRPPGSWRVHRGWIIPVQGEYRELEQPSRTPVAVASLTFPITLDIVRNGDDYDFKVDGSTIYTASEYTPAQHDSMAYYHITWGDGGLAGTVVSATVDNFGVPATGGPIPEPATMGALALAVAGLGGYVRRRRTE